jgi:anti-anti-sigma factor
VAVIVQPINEALSQDVNHIVVDLEEVTYFGSSVLGALLDGRKRCEAAGGTLIVRVTDDRQRRLFEITGLDALLEHNDAPEPPPAQDA